MDGNFGPTEQVLWPISVFSGIIMCKIAYEITGQVSLLYFKSYNKLSKSQKIEWNNRGFSTFHAIVAASISFYLLVFSDTFKDGNPNDLIVNRKSILSDAIFGISLGYFLADLAMILWLFPSLGGKEYVARILLFIYFFTHMFLHFDQVKTIFPLGFYSLLLVPSMLAVMNALWFRKIFRGMIKTISRKRHEH